ncbi:AF4/FMR2 family member lilli [Uranotaenia lowii]|uniref:AF4/FMR2 family member lilli n=1 Tax=Uranotaenia lowii TaxID=190385 RepID=UPI0024795475|nr:AF4/FMR2 family member lilli [Uranotaenia lowii]
MDVDSPNSLKRCSSAPQINNLLPTATVGVHHHQIHQQQQQQQSVVPMDEGQSQSTGEPSTGPTTGNGTTLQHQQQQQQSAANQNHQQLTHQRPTSLSNSPASIPGIPGSGSGSGIIGSSLTLSGHSQHQRSHSPHNVNAMSSSTSSLLAGSHSPVLRDPPPTSFSNIFAPRARRFSASFSPLAVISNGSSSPSRSGSCTPGPRLTPRISQLRQEESADVTNSREVNHEREIHSAMQMSQSYEDLTLVTENWSFGSGSGGINKHNEDLANPLHVALPSVGTTYCSSPSPTSRGGLGLQYPTSSPSPTRKYVTRRSMSPCTIRPSPLSSSVKRKFDLDDHNGSSCYSPPPLKKIFNPERGSSPVCQTPSPSPICPSPDSSTASFENGSNNASSSGRITPKFFVTKLSSGVGSNGNTSMLGGPPVGLSCSLAHPLHTDSPPLSTSSSSSLMMMDCGVSSSSGHHPLLEEDSSMIGKSRTAQVAPMVESSSAGVKIDCDEDITDLNVIASSTSTTSMLTSESSEAMMEEVLHKTTTTRPALPSESHCQSESELLDSSSSGIGQSHSRLSTCSISNANSTDNNSESSSSLCPMAFSAGGGSANPSASAFIANNIEIAEI